MTDLASVATRIQVEETRFKGAVSESLAQRLGKTMNYLLDHYAIPVGLAAPFFGIEADVPSGWLPCDGRAVSRTTYANLFTVFGTKHGPGDGSTTFNLPDTRGLFLRGVDLTSQGQAGVDPDHASRTRPAGASGTVEIAGSTQTDKVGPHQHEIPTNAGGSGNSIQKSGDSDGHGGISVYSNGTNETRPKNISALYIVKY